MGLCSNSEPTETQATFLCEAGPGEPEGVIGTSLEDSPLGGTIKFAEIPTPTARVPVVAVIEPDADGDGYGDETQDKCPQSAAVQIDCSPVGLDAFAVQSQGKVVVLVVATAPAKVKVAGSVKLPKGATASASTKLKPVTHELTPAKLGRFTLKFPGPLKSALGSLPNGKKLPLKLTGQRHQRGQCQPARSRRRSSSPAAPEAGLSGCSRGRSRPASPLSPSRRCSRRRLPRPRPKSGTNAARNT